MHIEYTAITVLSIAKRIRDARKGAGLSQEELAAACGVNQGTVSAWETGGSARVSVTSSPLTTITSPGRAPAAAPVTR